MLTELLHTRLNSAFEYGLWDVYDHLSLLSFSKELEEMDATQREEFGRSFVADAIFALNGCAPKSGDPVGRAWSEVMQSDGFKGLRRSCKDRMAQASVVMQLADMVRESLDKEDHQERRTDGTLSNWADYECKACGSTGSIKKDYLDEFGDGVCRGCGHPAMVMVRDTHAVTAAALPPDLDGQLEEIEAEALLIKTLGASMTGSPSERFEKALGLTDRFDVGEFVKFLGWAKRVVGGEARRQRGGTDEMTGYDSGRWSDRVVPDQMLGVAEGRIDTLAALADNALTRRKYDAKRESGRGPVVLLRDESSSMGPECGWVRHKSALAFELSLAEAFNREGRDLVSVAWSSTETRVHIYGEPGLEGHLSSFLGGGTRIVEPIEKAVEIASEYASGADILILTDGQLHMNRESAARIHQTVEPFRKGGGRVWAVSLAVSDERLAWTDGHIHIDQIGPGEGLETILRGMTRNNITERRRL